MYDFSGQTVLVTGGTRSIGRAVSEAFLRAGARVIATYVGNDEAAAAFRRENEDAGERLLVQKFDVADYVEVEAFFKEVPERFGSLEVLINNSGIRRDAVLAMMPKTDWDRVLQVNLTGVYHMCKFAVQLMTTQRYGRIVNVTSPSGKFGFEGQANYAASKAGMVALTKSLAREVAKRKITVNCVSPGYIDTDLIADLSAEQHKRFRDSIPIRRFGSPDEVAHATLFLATREATYITGGVLEVTGGI